MKHLGRFVIYTLLIIQFNGCNAMNTTQQAREKRIQGSPQAQAGKFINPNGVVSQLFSQETWEITKEYIFGERVDPKPLITLPVHPLDLEQWKNRTAASFSFSWLGHSSILIG